MLSGSRFISCHNMHMRPFAFSSRDFIVVMPRQLWGVAEYSPLVLETILAGHIFHQCGASPTAFCTDTCKNT